MGNTALALVLDVGLAAWLAGSNAAFFYWRAY